MRKLKVTIITVSFNSSSTIADTISSVASQTYSNLEHIIIDGGSTDGTVDIIKTVGFKIAKLISEPDEGIYDALNKGLSKSTGDIIGFLHSDDLFASDTIIEQICDKFVQNSPDIIYGDLLYMRNINSDKIVRYWKSNSFDKSLLNKGWMPPHPAMYIRRDVFKKYGQFDLKYRISSDFDFILRILKNNDLKVEYLPKLIIKMRLGGISNSSIKNLLLKSSEDYNIINKNLIPYPLFVLVLKNLRKINQFFIKK